MKKLTLWLLPAAFFSNFSYAATTPSSANLAMPYSFQDNTDKGDPVKKPDTQTHSVLPFLGDAARARGYDLPEPIGVNINYMNIRQNINVDSINFNGLYLGKTAIPLDNLFKIKVGNTREQSKTETIKLDAWLLPFMDVYTLIGHTEGSSVSNIGVNIGRFTPANLQNLAFDLDFKGTTYGIGTTLVGGTGNWFTAIDTNYTQTRFDILDGSIDAVTISPRIGYRLNTPAVDALHLTPGKLNVWVGTMYQDVQQEFKGKLSDLNMPTEQLTRLIDFANQKNKGRFDVKQHLQSPWNVLLGMQYELTRNFNITTEWGFAERNSYFISGEYRF